MKSGSVNRSGRERYGNGNDKDSFWGMAVLAVIFVLAATFAAIVYVDSQTGYLAGGIADENGAVTLAQVAAGLFEARN